MRPLTLREEYTDGDGPTALGRSLTIRIATIGRVYTVGRKGRTVLRERIAPGAFKEPLARPRGVLRFLHKGEHPGEADDLDNFYGAMTGMAEKDGQVFADFDVFEGPREDKLLALIDSGTVTGASMAMLIKDEKTVRDAAGPLTEVRRIGDVNAVSITPKNAYDDAGVVARREADPAAVKARLEAVERERKWWGTPLG